MWKSKQVSSDGLDPSVRSKDDFSKKPVVEEKEYVYNDFKWKDPFTKPKYIPWWIFSVVITIVIVFMTIKHNEIVETLRPISLQIRDIPGGFIIPVLILIAISFPPLFGHEIIGLLCGVVWGLWIGFAIVAVGTFVGEIGTWYAFKYLFRKKAVKLEKTNLNYGALARLTRDGGFWIILLIRFSVIPSHLSTAILSTCDVKFWHFAIATFLTLPKQITIVYVGVLLTQERQDVLVNSAVLVITTGVTLFAGVYIYLKMRKIKVALMEEQVARLTEKDEQTTQEQ
ncbi:hypothetical protein QTJ16_006417 [Diplocarpon rosae]|uniref:Golgi apparatus membrane protein TVP38 n=1 Tax=Diplocarpon rosae TaxID=946125 RepID=A0AAD9WAL3_9HELO|nr:hypothetical protein QTJ16_006417 [Diplocarpon rosae]PBP28200.1 hypothetical protein BUE80_DR000865 [Diplocarpon rosae]